MIELEFSIGRYRIFKDHNEARREEVKQRYLAGLDRVCSESFIECLARDRNGQPCIEIKTQVDLERDVDLDLGNIFHNTLSRFFTDDPEQIGQRGRRDPSSPHLPRWLICPPWRCRQRHPRPKRRHVCAGKARARIAQLPRCYQYCPC